MPQRAELDFEGWRLTVAPQGKRYAWWVISPIDRTDHKVIRHDDEATFEAAMHESHRTLQALLRKPVPKPTLLETP